MNRRLARCLPLLLALTPALLPLWQILHFGVDIPYWDQFDDDLAGVHIKAHEGSLTFADLAAQHNEHRILVPRLAYLALGFASDGNVMTEMLAGWAVAVATSLALLRLASQTRPAGAPGENAPRPLLWWFLANLLIFTPAQYENWLWGMGLANLLPMLWTALALNAAAAAGRDTARLAAVVAFSALAAWSSGNGMLCWGLAGAVLLWAPTWREFATRRRAACLLGAAAALCVALYFLGLAPPNHRGLQPYDSTLAAKLHYALVFAGAPFAFALNAPPVALATALGAALYALLAACALRFALLWRRGADNELCRRMLPWFAVAGFAVGSGLIAACARAGIGPGQAAASRYVSFALYLPVALLQLVPALRPWRLGVHRGHAGAEEDNSRTATIIATAGITVLLGLAVGALPPALRASGQTEMARRQSRAATLLTEILPGHPLITADVFPDAAVARRIVAGLARIGYLRPTPFKSPLARDNVAPRPPAAERCGRLENAWEPGPGTVAFTGWAVLPDAGRPADLFVLCVENNRGEPVAIDMAPVSTPRPDKTAELGSTLSATCGWAIAVPSANLFAHRRPATVTAWALDGATGQLVPLAGTVTLGQ